MLDTMTPESARDVPCDGCSMADECAAKGLECVAFRQWAADGDYMDKDVGRLRRAMKNLEHAGITQGIGLDTLKIQELGNTFVVRTQ